jgi:hypothetical protein
MSNSVISSERKVLYAYHLEHKINIFKDKLNQLPKDNTGLRKSIEKIVSADEARLMNLKMQFENVT